MEPELININTSDRHSSVVSMSTNGATLYIYKSEEDNGNIYVSEFEIGTGWTEPTLIGSDVNSEANEFYANIAYHEKVLYFTSDRKGGFGGKDIYFVRRLPDGTWGEAKNIGEPINTPYDEDVPYFHPDDRTMYFASNGHKSMGGYDIFYAQLGEDSLWGEPINIGYPINSTDDDHSYIASPDGERGYYASKSHGSIGMTDIYLVEYMSEEDQPDLDLSAFAVLKGWVITEDGYIPEDFKVVMRDKDTKKFIGEAKPVIKNGSFVFIVRSDAAYEIEYSLGNEVLFSEDIVVEPGTKYQEFNREIFLFKKQGKYRIIAIDDEVLGKVVKWKIALNDSEKLMPVNSKVYYMDEEGSVIDSSYLSKDGFFAFKQLAVGMNYILKPAVEGMDASQLRIDLVDERHQMEKIEMVNDEKLFIQKDLEFASVEHRDVLNKTTSDINAGESIASDDSELVSEDTPITESTEKEYKITFDYNSTSSNGFANLVNQVYDRIQGEINKNGNASINLVASSSTVPTSIDGGNYELSAQRLISGKAALFEALKARGLDMNKISTKSEKSIVSGPDYFTDSGLNKSIFVEYQYFKVFFN
ncbi:MAG: PD40 domain-containing protein [Flavobacteriales bacterium]|nr:PD40 domain-containing protein [Flavobacteriales bacterium]